jgi:hypothetical protein
VVAVAKAASKVVAKKLVVVKAVSKVVAVARAAAAVVAAATASNIGYKQFVQVSHSHGSPFLLPLTHQNHDVMRPILAAKMAAVVIQPRIFIPRVFTRLPMIRRLFVISMMSNSNGGVENPCTIPV